MYFKLDQITSRAMEEGKKYHEAWASEILQSKKLPKIFGNTKLEDPVCEIKIVTRLESWLELVGVIDCLEPRKTIHEFKTGVKTSESYASSMQIPVYSLLDPLAEKGIYYHFNQYEKKVDVSTVYLTPHQRQLAQNWVFSLSSEMHSYFLENDLYDRFGHRDEKNIKVSDL